MPQKQTPIRVVSRNSKLALKQVEEVFALYSELRYTLVALPSFGDKHQEISLLENPPADLFTRELDEQLLKGEADVAVHSAKDLPYPLPIGLEVIALLDAADSSDALVSRGGLTLDKLPMGAKIGTSSSVRKQELLALRPDVQVVSIRGTIEQRISLVDTGEIDALVVASCALHRLGLTHRAAEVLPFKTHPLQGFLAVVAVNNRNDLKVLFNTLDVRKDYGKTTLVGFGPGNPDLLTLAGEKALAEADSIFYDDLLDKNFLQQYTAEAIYVGKRKDKHSVEQADINRLLLEAVRQGKNVVRLKGGDPMVFAHGGEEVEYLKRHLTTVGVIPGISTALAASALTQVPLTHRGIASSVSFITGHSELPSFPQTDTVVVYMGASRLKALAKKAIGSGWNPETPVLLVSNVSLPNQQEVQTTLLELTESETPHPTPLIVLIGRVVSLRNTASEKLQKPTILVTGTDPELYRVLGNIVHQPFIQINPIKDYLTASHTLKELDQFDWIFFTSRHSVDFFFRLLNGIGKDSRSLRKVKVASIGKTTSQALKQHGILPDLQAGKESSEGLLRDLDIKDVTCGKVLLPRSDKALTILPKGLIDRGWKVKTLVLYRNSVPKNIQPIDLTKIDQIAFTSPSTVTNFEGIYGFLPEPEKVILKGSETSKRYYSLIRNRPSQAENRHETIQTL